MIKNYQEDISLYELEESFQIKFKNNEKDVLFTIPNNKNVREFFINIYISGKEIYSDWFDVYKIENETEEELDETFISEIMSLLKNLLQKDFEIQVDGKWLKRKNLKFK